MCFRRALSTSLGILRVEGGICILWSEYRYGGFADPFFLLFSNLDDINSIQIQGVNATV